MKKYFVFLAAILCLISYSVPAEAHKPIKKAENNQKQSDAKSAAATVCLSFEKIYDINFRDNEYKIDFWCRLAYPKENPFDFRNQLQIAEAKEMTITVADSSVDDANNIKLLLKIHSKMFHIWDAKGYPFDGQKLAVIIYSTGGDTSKFSFTTDGHGLHNSTRITLENGWEVYCADTVLKAASFSVPFGESNYHSSVAFRLDIHRKYSWGIFFKLFIGMYTAFLVAFLALFIDTKKHFEPRFGLMVGALFAAIANKYIVESILPESPYFNLVDRLHALTFFTITIAILLSVVALYLSQVEFPVSRKNKSSLLTWISRKAWLYFLIFYSVVSAIFIIDAFTHKHQDEVLSTFNQTEHHHSD